MLLKGLPPCSGTQIRVRGHKTFPRMSSLTPMHRYKPKPVRLAVPPGSLVVCEVGGETCDKVTPPGEEGQGMRGKYQMCHSPIRTVTGSCGRLRICQHSAGTSETCGGLARVKWALGSLMQQSPLFHSTSTRWPLRD